ncbi:hypothetical protein AT281_27735 [Bacillus cereus]|nr:hypothetical protein AT281_27735 [Bacillus cereus]
MGVFNTKTMKQHSKTHVNKVLFKKVVDKLYFIFLKLTMLFVMKWQMPEKVFYFLSIIVDNKTSICTRLCLFVPDKTNFDTFYNAIDLKNVARGSF